MTLTEAIKLFSQHPMTMVFFTWLATYTVMRSKAKSDRITEERKIQYAQVWARQVDSLQSIYAKLATLYEDYTTFLNPSTSPIPVSAATLQEKYELFRREFETLRILIPKRSEEALQDVLGLIRAAAQEKGMASAIESQRRENPHEPIASIWPEIQKDLKQALAELRDDCREVLGIDHSTPWPKI